MYYAGNEQLVGDIDRLLDYIGNAGITVTPFPASGSSDLQPLSTRILSVEQQMAAALSRTGLLRSDAAQTLTNSEIIQLRSNLKLPNEVFSKTLRSGDGIATSFSFPHGLGDTPQFVNVQAGSSDAKEFLYVETDAANITVYFAVAPTPGINNLLFWWQAKANIVTTALVPPALTGGSSMCAVLTRLSVTTQGQTIFTLPVGVTPGLVLIESGGVCEENLDYVVTGQTLTWVSAAVLDVGDDLYIIS